VYLDIETDSAEAPERGIGAAGHRSGSARIERRARFNRSLRRESISPPSPEDTSAQNRMSTAASKSSVVSQFEFRTAVQIIDIVAYSGGMSKAPDRRPRDPNQLGKLMVDIASGDIKDTISPSKKDPSKKKGRAGGLKGGTARAKALSEEERTEIARTAGQARWKKRV